MLSTGKPEDVKINAKCLRPLGTSQRPAETQEDWQGGNK